MGSASLPEHIQELLGELDRLKAREEEVRAELATWFSQVSSEFRGRGVVALAGEPEPRTRADMPHGLAPAEEAERVSEPELVIRAVLESTKPVGALDVVHALASNGIGVSPSNVRSFLAKGAKAGKIRRVSYGKYAGPAKRKDRSGPQSSDRAAGDEKLTTYRVAEQVLREAGRPLHGKDILARVAASGGAVGGQDPVNTLFGILGRQPDIFVNLGSNTWDLVERARSAQQETGSAPTAGEGAS